MCRPVFPYIFRSFRAVRFYNLEESSCDCWAQLRVREWWASWLLQKTTRAVRTVQFITELFGTQLIGILYNLFGTDLVGQSTLLQLGSNFTVDLILNVTVLVVVVQSILNPSFELQLSDDIAVAINIIRWNADQRRWNISNDTRLVWDWCRNQNLWQSVCNANDYQQGCDLKTFID